MVISHPRQWSGASKGISLMLLVASLLVSLWETMISTRAIEITLEDMAQKLEKRGILVE